MRDVEVVEDNFSARKEDAIIRNVPWWYRRTREERYMCLTLTTVFFVAILLALSLVIVLQNPPAGSDVKPRKQEVLPQASFLLRPKEDGKTNTPKSPSDRQPSDSNNNNDRPIITNNEDDRPLINNNEGERNHNWATTHRDSSNDVCLTQGCVTAAASLIEKMDESVNPCDDFYEFSCGKYVKNKIIPDEKSSETIISEISDRLKEKLRLLVEKNITQEDPPATKLVKTFYSSCKDTDTIEKLGLQPLRTHIDEVGGWPVMVGDSWDESGFSWLETLYKNREKGLPSNHFFDFEVWNDIKDSGSRIIWLDQPKLVLSREYFIRGYNDTDVLAYLKYSVDVAELLGADRAVATEEMKEVIDLQIKMAEFMLPREDRRDFERLYNVKTLQEMQEMGSNVPWVELANRLLGSKVTVDKTERIVVATPDYIQNVFNLLERTPKRVVANYLIWRIIGSLTPYLSEDIRDKEFKFTKTLSGKTEKEPRWKECINKILDNLSLAISSLYVKNFFVEDAKAQADELIVYIRNEFEKTLNTIDWMDEKTRQQALSKARLIKPYIGYPPELLKDRKLTDFYDGLSFESNEYLENGKRIRKFDEDYQSRRLREPVDKTDWREHGDVAVVNAYYKWNENSMEFPAGILQGHFFEPNRPKYMNFGAIGFVIGHEITHGFDDQGKQFDEEGNLKNWWEPETEKKFLEKAKCIIYQYGNYTAPENDMKINGVNTQGENIADNGGIKRAYDAYMKWVDDHKPELRLPGLNYTPNQIFWISGGQVWCGKYRPEALKINILTGVHSPGRFRINGAFRNSEDFARDFICPATSVMNSLKKCSVW